jgi:hypothetical protein
MNYNENNYLNFVVAIAIGSILFKLLIIDFLHYTFN